MIVDIVRICNGFINVGPKLPHGPEQYFGAVSQPTFVTKGCLYDAQTLILDAAVIYRAYIVWQNFHVVIVPIIAWLGLLASAIGAQIAALSHTNDVFAVEIAHWITAVYSLTLGTNFISTSLLAYRIWSVSRQTSHHRSSDVTTPVFRVAIESGVLYTLAVTVSLITYVTGSTGVYIMLDVVSPLMSIVFNMLILQAGLTSYKNNLFSFPNHPDPSTSIAMNRSHNLSLSHRSPKSYELRPVKVEVTQQHETFTDDRDDPKASRLSDTA